MQQVKKNSFFPYFFPFTVHFSKPFNVRVIQVCALISDAEEAEVEWFYEDLQDLLELLWKKMSSSL